MATVQREMASSREHAARLIGLGAAVLLIVLAFVFRLPAELLVRWEPVGAPLAHPDALITVTADERIFTLYAALNATGFDAESGDQMSAARTAARAWLAARDLPAVERLRPIVNGVAEDDLVQWMLGRGEAPDFRRTLEAWWVDAPASLFFNLAPALREFSEQADLDGLWAALEPEYAAAVEDYQRVSAPAIRRVLDYLREDHSLVPHIVIVPNLLDSSYSGYGPTVNGIAYVVSGPLPDDHNRIGMVEHEFLHSAIGEWVETAQRVIPPETGERLWAATRAGLPSGYGTWNSALEETLIRAIGARLAGTPEAQARQLDYLVDQGFSLAPPLFEALAAYEAGDQPFEQALPEIFRRLNEYAIAGE